MAQTIKVYNTKTGRTHPIHPAFAKDKQYLAARGLIIQTEVKPFQATNIQPDPIITGESESTPKPVENITPKKIPTKKTNQ